MKIVFEEGCEVKQELTDIMLKAATKALECEGLNDADCIEVSLSFVSPEEIKEINNQFRGIDKVTDVLSFPQFEDLSDLDELIEDEEVKEISLGDVVICTKRASEQAEEFGHSLDRELVYLFVHSILHLLGYDHMEEEEKAEMRAREEEIMQFVDLPRA